MNGSLHLGHGFTISKIEFATGFEWVSLLGVHDVVTSGLANTMALLTGA